MAVVKMGSSKRIPDKEYQAPKDKDAKYKRSKLRKQKVSQRETREVL